jgi:putative ATPase
MDLFTKDRTAELQANQPLAARIRPQRLDEIAGQQHIIGEGGLLRRAIEADRLSSIILYGPPGCGKTTIAEVIARVTNRRFERCSGVVSNVADMRRIIAHAHQVLQQGGQATILFVDEIHRFNKSQQDILLPVVEDGSVTLIGATTHNPGFFVNAPLTSRSLVFELLPLDVEAVVTLLRRALETPAGLGGYQTVATDEALQHLATVCEGDARRALNAIEVAVLTTDPDAEGVIQLTAKVAEESIQKKVVLYDRDEDGHYDTISAFIKSVRGSDPDAAVYWLAKMLYAGEDPRFVARRLVILASEDIGNADPRGLLMAEAALRTVEHIGMPEARITLAQATIYLATAPKSNAAYMAINKALDAVKGGRVLPVPESLKNVKIKAEGKDVGADYLYPHDFKGHHVEQAYIPTTARYYVPTDQGYEATIAARLALWRTPRRPPAGGDHG